MTRRFLPLFAATLLLGNASAFIARAQPPEPRPFQSGAMPTPTPIAPVVRAAPMPVAPEPESVEPESVEPESVEPESVEPESVEPETIAPEALHSPPGQSPVVEEAQPFSAAASRVPETPPIISVLINKQSSNATITVGEPVECTITLTKMGSKTGNKLNVTLWCKSTTSGDNFVIVGGDSHNQLVVSLTKGTPYKFTIKGTKVGTGALKTREGAVSGTKPVLAEESITTQSAGAKKRLDAAKKTTLNDASKLAYRERWKKWIKVKKKKKRVDQTTKNSHGETVFVYTDCGRFVKSVVNTPKFPEVTTPKQGKWMQDNWITGNSMTGKSGPRPGDVLWRNGHTGIYGGIENGHHIVYEASLGDHGPRKDPYVNLNYFTMWGRPEGE